MICEAIGSAKPVATDGLPGPVGGVRGVLFVFRANVLEHIRVRKKLLGLNCHRHIQMAEISPSGDAALC